MLRRMPVEPQIAALLATPAMRALGQALADLDAYLVGGAVRDALLGLEPGPDIDLAVDADPAPLLTRLGAEVRLHERFATATVSIGGVRADLARTRAERYECPGALPRITPATIDLDLCRRDFTINAMAVPLADPSTLIDPFSGREDLRDRVLRVLHDDSFVDDPTRAVRAARYAARLDLVPEPKTRELLGAADLNAVSADRRRVELGRLAGEPEPEAGFRLLREWGLLELCDERLALIGELRRRALAGQGGGEPGPVEAILLVAERGDGIDAALALSRTRPECPSEAVRLARGHAPAELLVAAAAGAAWVDTYLREWARVGLQVDGDDLIAAGIPQGPAVGAGLAGALARKLDGELDGGREAELAAALEIARGAI